MGYQTPANIGWFVREHRIEYLLPAFAGEVLEVHTWLSELKRVRVHRRYEFLRKADGKVVAKGETDWVCVDASSGRPLAIPGDLQVFFPVKADTTCR